MKSDFQFKDNCMINICSNKTIALRIGHLWVD